jgi:hypothetical protein
MSHLNEPSIPAPGADPGSRKAAAHEARGAETFAMSLAAGVGDGKARQQALWVIARRANGSNLWRAPVGDRVRGRTLQAAGLARATNTTGSIHRNSGTTPNAAGRFAGYDVQEMFHA